jgi:hypothetical protein
MLGPHTHRDNPLSRIMCLLTPCHGVSPLKIWLLFCFSGNFSVSTISLRMYSRVWECMRKLNPGGKGRRCQFRRGGTKTSSKEVKGSHSDHRSRRIRVIANRIHFTTPKTNHLEKHIEQTLFHFHNLKKEISWKLENYVSQTIGNTSYL